jgi:hypothetical protein
MGGLDNWGLDKSPIANKKSASVRHVGYLVGTLFPATWAFVRTNPVNRARVDRLRETGPSAGVSVAFFAIPYWGMTTIRIAFRGKRYKAAS